MSHLNMAQIQELKEIMEEGFEDLVATYLQDSDHKMNALQGAINENDHLLVSEIAHSLKGSSANICAETLSGLLKKVEDLGRAEDLTEVPCIFDDIQTEYGFIKTELQQLT